MEEYNSGMDPELKIYFSRIVKGVSLLALWMLVFATTGFAFGLALFHGTPQWYNFIYYVILLATLVALILYIAKLWKKGMKPD